MGPRLQKPFNAQLDKHTNFVNYSHITKLEHERRERGFQVFISGANKERLKSRDLQQEAFQAKKAQINTKITSTRKPKQLYNTFVRRKFWQKNSEIQIKGSDGLKIGLQNQKSTKPETGHSSSVLHDITSKTQFHPSAQKNSQLNLIRNRYKAYFHIDGRGFCCSKQTSKPSTPAKYQIDGATPIFNKNSFNLLKRIQNKHVCNSCFPQPYDNEEQKSQYYSLLDRNHERVSKLKELLAPDYEYFQSEKGDTIPGSNKGIANEANHADSCTSIIYDVFYHNEQNINRSAKALLPTDNQDEHSSTRDKRNAKDESIVFFQDDSCSGETLQINDLEKIEDENHKDIVFYRDEGPLGLFENQRSLNESINGNEETKHLPPLGKTMSPISKFVESSYNSEGKERCIGDKYQFLFNRNDKSSSNSITKSNQTLENVDNGKKTTLKLNLRYFHQGLDFKIPNKSTLDQVQSYIGTTTSTSSDENGSNKTSECSTRNSSTPRSYHILPTLTNNHEKVDSRLFIENTSILPIVDYGIVEDTERKNKVSIFPDGIERITKKEKLLSARIKKLDTKQQIYLLHILDKLEISQVTRSVDLNFFQYNSQSKESLLS